MPSFILLVTKESWFTSVNFSKDICDVRHLRRFSTPMTFYTETNDILHRN